MTTTRGVGGVVVELCIGCGMRPVRVRRTYCRLCKERLRNGNPVDLDEHVTMEEFHHLCVLLPGEPYSKDAGWKPGRATGPKLRPQRPRWDRRK